MCYKQAIALSFVSVVGVLCWMCQSGLKENRDQGALQGQPLPQGFFLPNPPIF